MKYILIGVLILVALFLSLGLITPSIYYESEVVVNKPANEAWAVMNDESKMTAWLAGFKRNEHVSGTPNTVGAVSNVYVDEGGQEMVIQETITNIIPEKLVAMDFTMDFMDMVYEMHLSESNGKTTILSKSTTSGNGLFSKSIVSLMKGAMKSAEDNNMANLKKIIDENTTDYFEVAIVE